MAALPQVRVNLQAPFPAFVGGSGPITLAKQNGVWTIGYNVMATAHQMPPLTNFATDFFLVYDSLSGIYFRVSLQDLEAAIGPLPMLPNNTVMGNVSGFAAPPTALTQVQLTALINNFSSTAAGIVPASGASPAAKLLHGDGSWSAPIVFTSTLQGEVPPSGGGATTFLRADGSWAIPPGGAGAVISVFGRTGAVVAQSGDYSFSQISGTAAPAQLPVFTSVANGAVTASGGGTTNFLRADGSWAAVNFAQITGAAGPTQMTLFTSVANGAVPASGGGVINYLRADGTWQPAPVTSFNGRTGAVTPQSGDYAFSQITGVAAASQLPLFTSVAQGAVAASGGGTVNFLRADGNWAAPGAGGGTLTIGTTAIGGGVTGRVLYDNGGILQEYTQAALTSYINLFTSTTPGTVPLSGGGTTNFLRADGSWVAPPSGGAGSIIIGTSTIGGGVSGRVLYDNAGLAGEYTQAQLTAQISAFTSTLSGAAPASGGGTTNFLRADGTWNAPPYPVTSVFGRTGAVVAATNDYSFSQISGTAAPAQLPLFTASLAGAVSGSGGGTANFLRADGTWAAPPTGTAPVTSVFGRTGAVVAAANDYSFSQISGTATPAQLPLFTSVANGIVAASGGGTVNFLRADGSWASPPGLGSIANNTVLGNVSGSTATPAAITATQLTTLVNPFTTSLSGAVPVPPAAPTTSLSFLRGDGWQPAPWSQPQGRLTLTANTPVMTAAVTAATSTIYTAYVGNQVPVFISAAGPYMMTLASDLTQTLADTTKSPAATVANSLYDMFVWYDSTLPGLRCTRGPVWTNTTTRSAGTALTRVGGLLVNNVAITNGPAVNAGTYVGTIATNASNQLAWVFGGAASGGTQGQFRVWNMYNRVDVIGTVTDNGASYTYTSVTARQARGSTTNNIVFVSGLAEEGIGGTYCAELVTVAVINAAGVMLMNLDTASASDPTNAFYYANPTAASINLVQTPAVNYPPQLGLHTLMMTEGGDGTNANTFNSGSANTLTGRFRM